QSRTSSDPRSIWPRFDHQNSTNHGLYGHSLERRQANTGVTSPKSGRWTDAAALSSLRLNLIRAIVRRLAIVGVVLLGVSALTFFVLGILPGNAAQTL